MLSIHKQEYLSILQTPCLQWLNDFIWIMLFTLYLIELFKDLEINWYRLPETFLWECTVSRIFLPKKHVRDLTHEVLNQQSTSMVSFSISHSSPCMAGKNSQKTVCYCNAWTASVPSATLARCHKLGKPPQLLYHAGIQRLEPGGLDVLYILL